MDPTIPVKEDHLSDPNEVDILVIRLSGEAYNDEGKDEKDIDIAIWRDTENTLEKGDKQIFLTVKKADFTKNIELEIDEEKLNEFVDNDEDATGQVRVFFSDRDNHLMSDPMYIKVFNKLEMLNTHESIDEGEVKLTHDNYKKFVDHEAKSNISSEILFHYEKIKDVQINDFPEMITIAQEKKFPDIDEIFIGEDNVMLEIEMDDILNDQEDDLKSALSHEKSEELKKSKKEEKSNAVERLLIV